MKKLLSLLLVACLCLLACTALVACNDTEDEPESQTELNTESDKQSDTATETEAKTETETDTSKETGNATEPETDPVKDPVTEPVVKPETEPATEPVTEPVTEPDSTETEGPVESDTELEIDTEDESEPATEPESETEGMIFEESGTGDGDSFDDIVDGEVTEADTEIDSERDSDTAPTYTVTPHEWRSAFDEQLITMNVSNETIFQRIAFADNVIAAYMEYLEYDFTINMTWALETDEDGNEAWWEYGEMSFDGDWAKEPDEYGNGARMYGEKDLYFHAFGSVFDSFTYDEETKQYFADYTTVYCGESQLICANVCVSFENGVITAMSYDSTVAGLLTQVEITDVGTTTATVPSITYGADEEEWESILTSDNLGNVVVYVEAYSDEFGYFDSSNFEFCDTAVLFNHETYFVKLEDGRWIELSLDEDTYEYIATVVSEDYVKATCDLRASLSAIFSGKYGEFTYDEESKGLVAENFEINGKTYDSVTVFIRNGKIVGIEVATTVTLDDQEADAVYTAEFFAYGIVDEEYIGIPEFTIPE